MLLPISRGLFARDQITFTSIGDTLALDDEWWECLSHCVFWRHLGNESGCPTINTSSILMIVATGEIIQIASKNLKGRF